MKFGIKVGIIKSPHIAKFEQYQFKSVGLKHEKHNFGKNA